MAQIIETVPENKLTVEDIEPLADELEAYQGIYDEYFYRSMVIKEPVIKCIVNCVQVLTIEKSI